MKKILIVISLLLILVSCGIQKLPAYLTLSNVNDKPMSGMQYIDDYIAIDWSYISRSRLNFKLKNNSDKSIKLIWDDVVYVNISGNVDKVMHIGVKYNDRNESQVPSIIPSKTFI